MNLFWLRTWVGLTGLAGLGAAIGAWWNPSSPIDTIYRNISPEMAAPLSRLYATWLLLSTIIRCTFVVSEFHVSLAVVTMATYVVAWVHFSSEIFIYHTVPLKPGGQAPLWVASFSMGWLLWCLIQYRRKKK
ncbi:putative ergosterol biosynthetic protein 28 isoform 1 [Galdieria sulphuraria]|uniref:Putative ergosterol biosynthetic protein 28 isoform 1 n=1 Tax=Galdieria sulphuraria TaxID=130081 RepID=M2Y395_GALSU|nr:putative ergosterol biosynthetic protein 28 isoform 1 [Galdieria sulphuraria]EME30289.1 putative ergosterol biosynthetic protein 28 isoform 1 [Galdieria sulphuraria]|eukprot:XP_005706809.1 putative ergosterol biosynthetic protein 28 isoform 1 [Galdieria sulphuraria]